VGVGVGMDLVLGLILVLVVAFSTAFFKVRAQKRIVLIFEDNISIITLKWSLLNY
jgi:hypothetical protein